MALFQPNTWYRLSSTTLGANLTLSSGVGQEANGALGMNTLGTYSSSENWQFFFQDERYFIRNYNYRNLWQLGLTSDGSSSAVAIVNIEANLGQQWLVEKNEADGTFILRSEEVGSGQMLGVSGAGSDAQVSLTPNAAQARWFVDPNPSAGEVPAEMLLPVKVIEPEPSPTSTNAISTTTQASSPSTSIARLTAMDTPTPTSIAGLPASATTTSSQLPSSQSTDSNSLSSGAIAGVAVGAAASLAIIAAIVFFMWRRSRRQRLEQQNDTSHQRKFVPSWTDSDVQTTPRMGETMTSQAPTYMNDVVWPQEQTFSPRSLQPGVVAEKPGDRRWPTELERPVAELESPATERPTPVELPGHAR